MFEERKVCLVATGLRREPSWPKTVGRGPETGGRAMTPAGTAQEIAHGLAEQRLAPLVVRVELDVSVRNTSPDDVVRGAEIEHERSAVHHLDRLCGPRHGRQSPRDRARQELPDRLGRHIRGQQEVVSNRQIGSRRRRLETTAAHLAVDGVEDDGLGALTRRLWIVVFRASHFDLARLFRGPAPCLDALEVELLVEVDADVNSSDDRLQPEQDAEQSG